MKLTDLFKEFTAYALLERCLEPTTIGWYERSINCFYKYLRRRVIPADLNALNVDLLRDLLIHQRQQGNSPRTIINLLKGLRSFCTFLVKRGHLLKNPFDGMEKPKLPRKLPEFLDEEEARDLLRACLDRKLFYKSQYYRDVAIIAMFLFTGVRLKELLNLRLPDLMLFYLRAPRLFNNLTVAKGDGRYPRLMKSLARTNLLIIDDWGLSTLSESDRTDLLEVLEDRHNIQSTIVTSQLPIKHWHEIIGNATLADAILDRLVHNAYTIELKGESIRKKNQKRPQD